MNEGSKPLLYYRVLDDKGLDNIGQGLRFYEYNLGDRSIFDDNRMHNYIPEEDVEQAIHSIEGHEEFKYVEPQDRYNYNDISKIPTESITDTRDTEEIIPIMERINDITDEEAKKRMEDCK